MRLKQNKTQSEQKLTPMMAQYLDVKQEYKDILLFYRMGDFYEMFLHDAEIAAEALGIALTHRGQIDGERVAMCGVPVHAADSYLAKLIKQGHKVAICEQSETPEAFKRRGGKGPLPRNVVRVVTPGTIQEDGLLDAYQNNFLAAVGRVADTLAVAWADMSTGSFHVQSCRTAELESVLARLGPAEFIYPDDLHEKVSVLSLAEQSSRQPAALFDHNRARSLLLDYYGLATLDGLGRFSPQMLSAAGGLLRYLQKTQLEQMPYLTPLCAVMPQDFMVIDTATRKSLELTQTLSGERKGSLLYAIDETATAGGARLLHRRLSAPLTDKDQIEERLELANWFVRHSVLMDDISSLLREIPDIERALARLAAARGGPRDLASLSQGLAAARRLSLRLGTNLNNTADQQITQLCATAQNAAFLAERITPALADELPASVKDGHFIARGYDSQLDDLRQMRDESRRLIAGLQARYCDDTQIASLKIKHNNVLGYHIDVRSLHGDKLMQNPLFIHRQTTAQSVRFTTTELSDMERQLSSAAERALALEIDLFSRLVDDVLAQKQLISQTAEAVADIDVALSTACLCVRRNYCCPQLGNDRQFAITAGRHPVVEKALAAGQPFIANDCHLTDGANLWLLTGPNMAGKSTYLRQNAQMAILAQAGVFVPASAAKIGIVDKIFSRVGASDDLARGQSTFMVEMVETAAILNQSTDRSLVILDEIGRGTATWDGLAIAWACLEYLHDEIGCRALFATHYHELTGLEEQLERLATHAMQVKEWKGDIVFLHQVAKGAVDRSYGVHVARLAGLPVQVTKRAGQLVKQFDNGHLQQAATLSSLPLFDRHLAAEQGTDDSEKNSRLTEMIDALEPDSMTPKQALSFLYDLKGCADEGKK